MAPSEKGNMYALAALKDQRARLAGEIIYLQNRLKWAGEQIRHVDASLQLLDPQLFPNLIPAKRPQKRIKLFRQGELGRLIMDALRRAGKPIGTQAVVSALLKVGGHTEVARPALSKRVAGNLAYLRARQKVKKIGTGRATVWALI